MSLIRILTFESCEHGATSLLIQKYGCAYCCIINNKNKTPLEKHRHISGIPRNPVPIISNLCRTNRILFSFPDPADTYLRHHFPRFPLISWNNAVILYERWNYLSETSILCWNLYLLVLFFSLITKVIYLCYYYWQLIFFAHITSFHLCT